MIRKWLVFYSVFFLILGTIIGSCGNNYDKDINSNKVKQHQKRIELYEAKINNNRHIDEITYKKIICPKCNGVGKVEFSTAGKVMFGIVTLGMGCLTTPTNRCETCYGTGYIEVPDI